MATVNPKIHEPDQTTKSASNQLAPAGLLNIGADQIIEYCSGHMSEHAQLRGKRVEHLANFWRQQPDDICDFGECVGKTFTSGSPTTLQQVTRKSTGKFYRIDFVPRFEPLGPAVAGVDAVFHVADEGETSFSNSLERSADDAQYRQVLLAGALETGRVSSWEWIPEGKGKLHIAGVWRKHFGLFRPDQFLTTAEFLAAIHPDDLPVAENSATDCRGTELDTFEIEYRLRMSNGSYTYISSRGRVIERSSDGVPRRIIGTFTDINELKQQQSQLEGILKNSRQALVEWDRDNDLLHLSSSWYDMFGYEPGEVRKLAPQFAALIHPDDRERTTVSFNRFLREPNFEHRVEYRLRHKDGHYLWVAEQGIVSEQNGSGRIVKVTGSQFDITAYRQAVDEAKNAWKFLQLILDEIRDKIFWKDKEHRLLGCNKAYAEMLGYTETEAVVGKTTRELFPAALATVFENDDNHVFNTGKPILRQERFTTDAAGNEIWTELTKLPLTQDDDTTISEGLLCHFRDITLERERRRQLEMLAEITSGDTGERVLERLVRGAAQLAQTDIAFIGRINKSDDSVTIIASHSPEENFDGVKYSLESTPCHTVINENMCTINGDIQTMFPEDLMLQDLGIEAYLGRRLLDGQGKIVGIFVLMHTSEVASIDQAASMVDILSTTAAYELVRETRENALIESEKRYRNIYDSVPVMICTTDEDHNILDINSRWIETTGYIRNDIVGKSLNHLFAKQDKDTLYHTIADAWSNEASANEEYLTIIGLDGEEIIVTHQAVYTANAGTNGVTINVFEDMRERYESAQQLRLAATAFETHEPLVIRDENMRVLRVNAAFSSVTGYGQSEMLGTNTNLFDAHDKNDVWKIALEAGQWEGNGICQRKNANAVSVHETITVVRDENGEVTHFVENFNDITDYVEALAETERLAYFDSLTELPNRRQLTEKLEASLTLAQRDSTFGALMFIDLDHFKNINDAVGHSVGDQVLQQVSKRLMKILRSEDTIARLGGDEFVVLIPKISADLEGARNQSSGIAAKIQQNLRRLYYLDDHEFHITPTIGVTLFPTEKCSVDDVLKQADTAMYRAKEEGRNQTKFYDESMQDQAQERLSIEKDLRTAVQREELHLVFQPQVLANGKVFGAEALLRWEHPTRGMVSPAVFIPVAEETGLIIEIGRWVLDEAFRVLAEWEANNILGSLDHLAINVSSRQFSGHDFVEDVRRRMRVHGTNASKVVLEVTESTVIDKIQATVSKMEELKSLGVRFSVDDFGTGYSSLAYLSRLPLDQLKIDRTFVANIHADPANAVIVETIISMGRHLHLQTVAEGVEEKSQIEFLEERRCNAYQGYYFSKPLPLAEFESFLLTNQAEFA